MNVVNAKKGTLSRKMLMFVAFVVFAVAGASADMTSDLSNFTTVATTYISMFTSVMAVFMQPPLVYFVAFGICAAIIRRVKGLVVRRA